MEKTNFDLPAEVAGVLDVGVALGQNHAFGLVAGRCSAAQAETLRRLKTEKQYQQIMPRWRDFCSKYLNMSGAQVDHIIKLLDDFGPGYFELSQLTRVSPDTYRAIEPSIKDGALHFNGEAIELNPENAQRVAAAVAELRRALPPAEHEDMPLPDRIAALDRRCTALLQEFARISAEQGTPEWQQFNGLIERMRCSLSQVCLEKGVS